jgi:hypothetical protein
VPDTYRTEAVLPPWRPKPSARVGLSALGIGALTLERDTPTRAGTIDIRHLVSSYTTARAHTVPASTSFGARFAEQQQSFLKVGVPPQPCFMCCELFSETIERYEKSEQHLTVRLDCAILTLRRCQSVPAALQTHGSVLCPRGTR